MRALITGASRGIGAATARRIADPAAELILHYHTHRSEAEATAREATAKGAKVSLVEADLSRRGPTHALAQQVASGEAPLDALVLNAGAYPRASFEEISEDAFEECFRLNVFGPAQLCRELLPGLRRSAAGRIVLVSSVLAFTGTTHGAHYAAAKSALLGLGRSLARELAPGITVNMVAPGSIDTAILADDTPARRAERGRSIPLGRVGTAEEVANAIAFLLSPAASYVTGTTVHVNGGSFVS